MNRINVTILALALGAAACGGDDDATNNANTNNNTTNNNTGNNNTGNNNTGNNNAGQIPARPTLGTQIDRSGRPGITTALVSPLADDTAKGADRDAYNAAGPGEWASYADGIAASLAVYDSLDTVCGNQVLAGADAEAGRYGTLAGALADDRLYVDTSKSSCGQYLAVELNATGVIPNDDCGGRTPNYDVIDTTYSALAIGAPTGVGDGVDADDGTHSDTAFPFLAAP